MKHDKNRNCILKVGSFNCHGLLDKVDYPDFHELALEFDILGVTETWLGKNDKVYLPNFNYIPLNRVESKGPSRGGIGFFIKSEIRKYVKIQADLNDENFMWCKVDKSYLGYNEDLYICVVYIPPESSPREKRINKDHFETLINSMNKIKSENIVLVGDFNSRTHTLDDTIMKEKHDENYGDFYSKITKHKRSNKDQTINKYGKKLTEFCIASGCFIANGRTLGDFQGNLTCHEKNGSSTVDYAIVNLSLNKQVRFFQVLQSTIGSDHCPIKLELRTVKKDTTESNITPLPKPIKWNDETKMLLENRMNSIEITRIVEEIDTLLNTEKQDINLIAEKLSEIYAIRRQANVCSIKRKHKSSKVKVKKKWYDQTCQEMSRKLKDVTKLLAKSPNNPHTRGTFCKTRKEYNKLIKNKKKEWKHQMINYLESLEEKDPKEYWKLVSEIRGKNAVGTSFDAENFTSFFEKLYSPTAKVNDDVTRTVKEALNSLNKFTDEPNFTLEELIKAIRILKTGRAAGPDQTIAEMFKASPLFVLERILKVMNSIKVSLHFPEKWAEGITSLIHKDGDDDDPNNYRAITVTSALAKILAILVNERLDAWATETAIQRKEQIGFTKKCRPSDHLFVLKTLINSYNGQNKKLYTCFVDFQKAFDSVWREALFYKLIKSGMNIGYIKLIKVMYEKTKQSLKLNGGLTRSFRTGRGVKQGCILSPRLFNLFLNDLPEIFDDECSPVSLGNDLKISCLLYADDLVLLSESPEGLQKCLDRLSEYTEKWDLKINLSKTKILVFKNNGGKNVRNPEFFAGRHKVEESKMYKYLGTIISNTGNFKSNENNLKKKGLRASFIISKHIAQFAKPSISLSIFEKVVEPLLLYNSEVTGISIPKSWDSQKFLSRMWDIGNELNRVYIGFARQILGVHKKSSNIAIHAETGKFPICIKIFSRVIKYWTRLQTTKQPLLAAARDLENENYVNNRYNMTKVVGYLRSATNTNMLPIASTKEANHMHKTFFQNIQELYLKWWEEQKPQSTKLDFYYRYKKIFRFEPYLDKIPKYIRCHLTRLRVSSHSLPIEVMRYSKKEISRDERKCTICNLDKSGNEEHYLLECNNAEISHLRSTFLKSIRVEVPQIAKFTDKNIIDYCLNLGDDNIQMKFGILTKNILETYREETDGLREKPELPTQTKSGREIRKPQKLDL